MCEINGLYCIVKGIQNDSYYDIVHHNNHYGYDMIFIAKSIQNDIYYDMQNDGVTSAIEKPCSEYGKKINVVLLLAEPILQQN